MNSSVSRIPPDKRGGPNRSQSRISRAAIGFVAVVDGDGHGQNSSMQGPARRRNSIYGYRIAEAAEYMGVTPWFVEVKIRSGELPALKLCRHYTILKQDMDAFLDRHRSALTQSAKDAA